ncbi:MAG: biotin transporter BioY [Bacillota bacterium]
MYGSMQQSTARRVEIQEMALVGLFTAVVVAMALVPPITLPLSPVPITLQTLGVMLAGCVLRPRAAALSLVVFLLLMVAGAPVLPGGRGGASYLFGPTGGYLLSWPLAAWAIALFTRRFPGRFWGYLLANVLGGMLLVYAIGVPVLAAVAGLSFRQAVISGALLYVPGDLLKAAAAAALALELRRRYPVPRPKR